jgi:hypothetical protein
MLCSRRDSNPYHEDRNHAFYPLNYGSNAGKDIQYIDIFIPNFYFGGFLRAPWQINKPGMLTYIPFKALRHPHRRFKFLVFR